MNQICRDIFRAIHEGKWLKIEYRNKADQITKYWIGIRDLDPANGLYGNYFCESYKQFFNACLPKMQEMAVSLRQR